MTGISWVAWRLPAKAATETRRAGTRISLVRADHEGLRGARSGKDHRHSAGRRDRAARPASAGDDRRRHCRGHARMLRAAAARGSARAGAADPVDRQIERAHSFAWHADAFGRHVAARAGRDRGGRAPRRPAQAGARQFARRQRLGDRDRGARASRALRHAGGGDALALVRAAGGHVRRGRSRNTASMPATSRPR